ncbi:MAG: flagellar motor switch protein FliG, partial [Planctomycetaceae bacterium]|nr:flagellar motor switch protein FliG [Planctomycetaceae bacterium]
LAAHVSVKPRGGRELSLELVQSLKQFIAGALAGAQTDDVTVVDMNTSRVYGRRSAQAAASERTEDFSKQHAAEYSNRITDALRYIPDVLVSVNVELLPTSAESAPQEQPFVGADFVPVSRHRGHDRTKELSRSNHPPTTRINPVSSTRMFRQVESNGRSGLDFHDVEDIDEVRETESPGYRKSVQVAVSIPEDYYTAIARSRGLSSGESVVNDSAYRAALANIKAETQRDVREKLIRLLPRGSDPGSLSVTTYTPLNSAVEPVEVARASTSDSSFETYLELGRTHWKIGTGAAICGLCFLWVVCRSRSQASVSPTATFPSDPSITAESPPSDEPDLIPAPSAAHVAVLDKLAELERSSPTNAVSRDNPFAFFDELSANESARMLASEHPQTIALVATALGPAHAANILHSLPESLRWDVTQRLSRIGTAAPDVLREVAASLKSRMHQRSSVGPRTFSEDARTPASQTTEDQAYCPITFEDLGALDVRSLATVLESVELRACAVALLDRSEAFKQGLLGKLPRSVSSAIRQQFKNLGPVRLLDITASQEAIAGVAWNLAQNGVIASPESWENAI